MVKEKPNSTRTYDAEGFRRRAACICVRSALENEVRLRTLLASSLSFAFYSNLHICGLLDPPRYEQLDT